MKNFQRFLKEKEINFKTYRSAISWLKSLKPKNVARVGSSYFIDENEMNQLFEQYLIKQIILRKKRVINGKKNFAQTITKKRNKMIPKE